MGLERMVKINELIKRELSNIFIREMEMPDNSLTTITQVETTQDLFESKIWVSIFPYENSTQILGELIKKSSYFKGLLGKRIRNLKPFPKLKFVLDKTEEKAKKIEKVLDKISSQD